MKLYYLDIIKEKENEIEKLKEALNSTYKEIEMLKELGQAENNGFTLEEMHTIQRELQEKYKEKWGGLSPQKGKEQLLWMMSEAGEVADIIKKKGDSNILKDKEIRNHFVEELSDVLMYFNDVMLCYSISPEEIKKVYLEKHKRNMSRW